MPSRLIRDDMLDSERVQTLPMEARWLYVTVLLLADDIGLFEVNTFKLGRKSGIDQPMILSLVQFLADADLLRLYRVDGKQYAFIPRYRQRVLLRRFKHPLPPFSLYEDDTHAFNQINDLAAKLRKLSETSGKFLLEAKADEEKEPLTGFSSSAAQNDAGTSQGKAEGEPDQLGAEWLPAEFRKPAEPEAPVLPPYRVPDCPYQLLLDRFHERLPILPRILVLETSRRGTLRARWMQVCAAERFDAAAGLAWFDDFYRMVSASAFLTGQKSGFKAGWDWLHAPKNFLKTIEGNYV